MDSCSHQYFTTEDECIFIFTQVVEKRQSGSKDSVTYLRRSMKKIGRSVGRSNPAAIARQVMSHSRIKKEVLKVIGKRVRKE